jgi:hypothetical protein
MPPLDWPLVVLILGILFMIIFYKPIASLIGRVQEINKSGIRTSPAQIQKGSEQAKQAADEIMKTFDNVLLKEIEDSINKDLEARGLGKSEEAIKVLVRLLASNRVLLAFEYLYSVIWGSQLSILQTLNSKADGETVDAFRPIYDFAATLYPEAFNNYTFDKYVDFLKNANLMTRQGDRYYITVFGREFLSYLIRSGRNLNLSF